MICTCSLDPPCFQNRNSELTHFQSVEAVNRPAYLSGMGVALSLITMDIQSVNSGEGAANKSVSKACASEDGPDAGTGASDAVFNILIAQLMGSIVQNNQQAAPDAGQGTATDSAVSGKNVPATRVAQDQEPSLPTTGQQAIDQSSSLSEGEKQAGVSKTAAAFSELLNVDERNKQDVPTQPQSVTAKPTPRKAEALAIPVKNEAASTSGKTETAGLTPVRNDTTEKPGQSVSDAVPGSAKTDYNMILLQQNSDERMGQDASEDASRKNAQSDPMPVKTDFLTLMHQGQFSVQHQPAFTASAQKADAPASTAPLQQHGTDLADIIDHNVSIVKDGSRLAVKLEPDGLGKLDINLRLDKGMISAQIHVSNDAAKNLLENNMQQMVNALAGEGLSVGGFSVSLNHKGASDGSAEGGQDSGNNTRLPLQTVGEVGTADARGLVSIFV
jgi:flagellar hook-length control protein FliK